MLRQGSLRWPFISQLNTAKCQQRIRQSLHFNCTHLANPYINCDSSDFWYETDGSSKSLPEAQYCEKSLFTRFARWRVTEWGTTAFLSFSLLGNEVTSLKPESLISTKHQTETETNGMKMALTSISLAINLHLYITIRNYNWTLTRGRFLPDQNEEIWISNTSELTKTWFDQWENKYKNANVWIILNIE